MEFLVEFEMNVPEGTPDVEFQERGNAEAAAAAVLVREGYLVRLWKPPAAPGEAKAVGLYRAESEERVGRSARRPAALQTGCRSRSHRSCRIPTTRAAPGPNLFQLPDPGLTPVYRLDATVGQPLDLGDTSQGHRRIVPLTGGSFTGPEINGTLIPGASADWQTVLPDGTALGDIRYTLQTDGGAVLYVQSRGVRHGSADVLARLGRGEAVDRQPSTPSGPQPTIETAAPELDWLNKGRLHQRRRTPPGRRRLRDIPGRMSPRQRRRRPPHFPCSSQGR